MISWLKISRQVEHTYCTHVHFFPRARVARKAAWTALALRARARSRIRSEFGGLAGRGACSRACLGASPSRAKDLQIESRLQMPSPTRRAECFVATAMGAHLSRLGKARGSGGKFPPPRQDGDAYLIYVTPLSYEKWALEGIDDDGLVGIKISSMASASSPPRTATCSTSSP